MSASNFITLVAGETITDSIPRSNASSPAKIRCSRNIPQSSNYLIFLRRK